MQDAEKVAALLERVISNQVNLIDGSDALAMLAAVDTLRGNGLKAMERRSLLEAEAKREKWQRVDVTMRGLAFWQLYAFIEGAKQLDCAADGDTVLRVFYSTDYSDDRPQLVLQEVVCPSPLVLCGEHCEHTIGAYQPILADMCEHLKGAIREMAEYAVSDIDTKIQDVGLPTWTLEAA